jgi:hypothetical protein
MFALPRKLLFLLPLSVLPSVCAQLGELPIKSKGKLDGILVAKGNAWIEVKDDEGYPYRYLPSWIGGPPARGGGYDPQMLSLLEDIPIGNRVQLTWHWDGHLRVDRLKLLRPYKKKGAVVGTIVDKGEKWVEVLSSRYGIPSRYYAKWVGGSPDKGGGYDQAIISRIGELESGYKVKLVWSYDIRPRVLSLLGVDEDEDAFVPFYEQARTMPEPNPVILPAAPANPFDQVPDSVSPFDQIPSPAAPVSAGNPFDMAPKSAPAPVPSVPNPFDAAQTETLVPANPFDEKIPANPFDAQPSPVPANPLDR